MQNLRIRNTRARKFLEPSSGSFFTWLAAAERKVQAYFLTLAVQFVNSVSGSLCCFVPLLIKNFLPSAATT